MLVNLLYVLRNQEGWHRAGFNAMSVQSPEQQDPLFTKKFQFFPHIQQIWKGNNFFLKKINKKF